jgi:hypothetical protein
MSHWFHRNPLKATGQQNFEIKMFAHDSDALKVNLLITASHRLDLIFSCPRSSLT